MAIALFDSPKVVDLLLYHTRMAEMVLLHRRNYEVVTATQGAFFGLSKAEYEDALERLRDELDQEVVLAMVASVEATLRMDFDARIKDKTRDPLRPMFKNLRDKYDQRVRLDDIVDCWKEVAGKKPNVFARIGSLLKYRHWLAHGRYWSVKTGSAKDPQSAAFDISEFYDLLCGTVSDFPR